MLWVPELMLILIPLGPKGAKVLMEQHLLEQLLENRGRMFTQTLFTHERFMSYAGVTSQSWRAGSCECGLKLVGEPGSHSILFH